MASKSAVFGMPIIANITLFAVLVYELIGPTLTKISLQKADEINPEGKTSARHERHKNKPDQGRHKTEASD